MNRYFLKKNKRVWRKKVAYTVRQKIANDRQRVKGRFTCTKKDINVESKDENLSPSLSPPNMGLKNEITAWPEP